MLRQLHELSRDELIAVIQDYQEMVNELEELAHRLMTVENYKVGDEINAILYKQRTGWDVHADVEGRPREEK